MRITNETDLIPEIIADTVCNELLTRNLLAPEQNASLQAHLIMRAERCYDASCAFRKKLRRATGRDSLYAFMRHWSADFILKNMGAKAYAKLPDGYNVGQDPGPELYRQ